MTQTAPKVTSYEYTIKYVDQDGTEIQAAATRQGIDGEAISLLSSDKSSITYNGEKYVYVSDDSDGKIVSSKGTTITVIFRKAYTATLNVTTIINGSSTINTTNFVEADDNTCSWRYAYPLYVLKDGKYYIADNTDAFGEEGTFTNGEVINKIRFLY